jgi:putative Mg2+ transporter-C (MgtC) family protein
MDTAEQLALLAAAFILSSIIGFEREVRQRSAGLKTHTLVGVGAALFTLAGRFGFGFASGATIDPSRVAAQVVSGIGFIGAGVVFVRKDGVKGLTTAATIWLTAAIGLAVGAGMVVLATAATVVHLIVTLVYAPLVRKLPPSRRELTSIEVSYRDGQGVLRDVLSATTDLGYVVANVEVARDDARSEVVAVSLDAEGKRGQSDLVSALQRVDGVVGVRSSGSTE